MLQYKHLTIQVDQQTLIAEQTGDLRSHHLIGLMGPNGSGKSTWLRVLAGVLAPLRGEVWYGGQQVSPKNLASLSRIRAYIPPVLQAHWHLSARHVFELGGTHLDEALVAQLDLTSLLFRPFSHLSSGERARVMVGHVLARRPRIVLADEITSPLDAYYQGVVMELLRDYAHQGHMVLLALHQRDLVNRYCDYGLEIYHQALRILPGNGVCLKPVKHV